MHEPRFGRHIYRVDGHRLTHSCFYIQIRRFKVTLCRFHHRAVHEGKVEIHVLDDGAIRFVQPNGECVDSVATGHNHPISDWRELPRQHDKTIITTNSRTAVTRWDGGPMDFGMAVDSLLYRARAAKNPPRGGLI